VESTVRWETGLGRGGRGSWFRGTWLRGAGPVLVGGGAGLAVGIVAVVAFEGAGGPLAAAACGVVIGLGGWWAIRRRPAARDGDEPVVSLVALLERPAQLESTLVAVRASEAWGIDVGTEEDENETAYAVGESPHFLVRREAWLLAVHDVDEPYFDDPDRVANYAPDLRTRRAIERHRGWLSVDVLYAPRGADPAEAYRLIGRLLAELVGDDLLAVRHPDDARIHPRTPELLPALRSDDPLAALRAIGVPAVLTIREDDPRMVAAVATARSRWAEFVAAFESRTTDDGYTVKVPIGDGESTEFLWVNVTAIENDVVYGTLGNDPVGLRNHRLHDRAAVRVRDVNDWLYVSGGRTEGGFTLELFRRMAGERDAEGG
jgi:uncharacterized protein YegJ (DUF2314 family)